MDINQIVNIVNYSLLGLFIFIIVALCYSFIRGLFRGWRYATYRLGYFLIHIIVGIACLTLIADAIGKFPLFSVLNQTSGSVSFSDTTISFQITTMEGTLNDFITQLIRHYTPTTDPTNATNIAQSLTRSFLMIVTILIEGILLATIFNFFCFSLWHLIFKRFIPKKKRKATYRKGKLVAGFESFVCALLVGCMILIPCSSLINSAIHGFNLSTSDNQEQKTTIQADDSTYQIVKSVADTYNNSLFSKAFFSWNADENGYSFDQRFMNWLTSSSYEDVKISFVKELQYFSQIGTYAIETGILSQSASNAHKTWMFLTSEYSPLLIRTLAKSDLLTGLLPVAFSIMTNMDSIEAVIGNEWNIDYTKNDWSKSITNIADLFSDIQNTGVLGMMAYSQEEDKIIYDTSNEINLFSEEKNQKFEDAFLRIKNDNDSWDIFNKLLISFSVNTVINAADDENVLSFKDFLPHVSEQYYKYDEEKGRNVPYGEIPSEYLSLDLGQEILYIYRAFSRLDNIDHDFLGSLINGLLTNQFDTKEFSNLIVDNIDEIISIFTGEGEDGTFDYDDSGISKDKNCLLDCSLICNAMPKVFKLLGNSLSQSLGVDANVEEANQKLFYGTDKALLPLSNRIKNEKAEVAHLLSVVSAFAKEEAGKELLKNFDNKPGITYNEDGSLKYIDEKLLDSFIEAMKQIDDSILLSEIVPDLFDGILSKNSDMFSSFSLSSSDFNFHPVNEKGESVLGYEISSLLSMYQKCQDLFDYIKSNTNAFSSSDQATINLFLKGLRPFLGNSVSNVNDCDLFTLLNSFSSSKILNPMKESGETSNYLKVMNKIITSALGDAYSYNGEIKNPSKENSAICKILSSLIDQDLLDTFGDDSLSLSSFAYVNFEELLSPLNDTTMMKTVFASFLDDKLVKDVLNLNSSSGVSFKNVTNWNEEGLALNKMVVFASTIGDFKNINLMDGDPVALSGIVRVLSQNEMFIENDGTYHFGEFFYDTLMRGLEGDSTKTLFANKDKIGGEYTYDQLKSDIASISQSEWINESAIYGEILESLSLFGGMNLLSGGSLNFSSVNIDGFSSLMKALASSCSIGRVLSYHVYEKIGEELQKNCFEIGNGYGKTGLKEKTGNMNLDELWNSYNDDYHGPLNREEEFSLFPKILSLIISKYGLLSSDGTIQPTMNINTTSTEFLIKPLLNYLSKSVVFNSLPDSAPDNLYSAFESEMAHIAYQSGIYGTDESKKNATFAKILGYVGELRILNEDPLTKFVPKTDDANFATNFDLFINNYVKEITTICNALDDSRSINVDIKEWQGGNLPTSLASNPRNVVVANSVIASLKASKIFSAAVSS